MASDLENVINIETEMEDMEAIKKDLLRNSTKGEWDGVIDIYKKHPEAHAAKLTINEDTALHIAVSSDREETVNQLIYRISHHHGEGQEIPEFKDKGGNTPLHVAASMGSVTLCKSIVETDRQLGLSFMKARNCKGETPLFLAALWGKKETFISVHKVYQENNLNYMNDLCCRSDDGDTILHVAIATKCFDLALEIIKLYPTLVHFVNKQGFSPLHVLASDPSAFESATMQYGYVVLVLLANCFPSLFSGYLRKQQKRKLAVCEVMDELLKLSDQDGKTDPNMIIGPEMVGDHKQESPTDGSTSGLGTSLSFLFNYISLTHKTTKGCPKEFCSMARETPILIAAKNGITEMVKKILEFFPEAVYDVDSNMKNIVLLSVEHKQPEVYELLLQKKKMNIIHDSVFWEVDNDGNTALHLAAKVANSNPWPVDGPALQMNWEIKWFKHVQNSMPKSYRFLCNKAGETPTEVFTKSHEVLVKEGRKWLIGFSKIACPVAAGVFVTVAFSSSSKPEVQINETNSLKQSREIQYTGFFATSSFSFLLSAIAMFCFLLNLTSPYSERGFGGGNIMIKAFLFGLSALYLSVIFTVESFVYGHFPLRSDPEIPAYHRTCGSILMSLFILVLLISLHMYYRLVRAFLVKKPQRKI